MERDTPTSPAVIVEDDESGESDSEGEEPVTIGATKSESQIISILGFPPEI